MLLSFTIFGSYFAFILFCIAQTSRDWLHGKDFKYKALALVSLGLTWERMLRYFAWSFHNYHRDGPIKINSQHVAQWLSSTSLFREAWQLVTASPEARLITQRICFATIFWTVFLHKYRNVVANTYIYMLLGQTVAISFAMNLYFSALLHPKHQISPLKQTRSHASDTADGHERKIEHRPASTLLVQCIFVAVLSTLSLNALPERLFLKSLLLLHGILLIPLMVGETTTRAPRYLNAVLAIISFVYTLLLCSRCSSLSDFYRVIRANPAVGSIAFDALMTVVSIVLWNGQVSKWGVQHLLATSLTPLWQAPISEL